MKIGPQGAVPSLSEATYDSIRKWYPAGSDKDKENALTIQDVGDDKLFAAIYAFHSETLMAGGEVPRVVKEEISLKVSENNACPYCVTGHAMMHAAARHADAESEKAQRDGGTGSNNKKTKKKEEEEQHLKEYAKQAVAYAERLQMTERGIAKIPSASRIDRKYPLLNEKARAEIACVVLLVGHMNRVADTLVGPSMFPSWMPTAVTNILGSPRLWARFMYKSMGLSKPLKEGFTKKLFEKQPPSPTNKESFDNDLPVHLEGIKAAGEGRSSATGRLQVTVDMLYEEEISAYVPIRVLRKIEESTAKENKPVKVQPRVLPVFVKRLVESMDSDNDNGSGCDEEKKEAAEDAAGSRSLNEVEKATAWVLAASAASSSMVYQSENWLAMVDALGVETSRKIVVWFSLKWSLQHIKGLSILPDRASIAPSMTTASSAGSDNGSDV